jgi:hypothetical protein
VRRTLWFAAGAGAGIYAMVRGRRAAEIFTVEGLRDRVQALGVGARIFRDEVAQGAVEKQTELRERYAAAYDTTPRLEAASGPTDRARPAELTYEKEGKQ